MIMQTYIIHDGTGTDLYTSPPVARGGLAALFSINVTHKSGSPTMLASVEHKNADEVSWASAASFASITATGMATKDISGLKEQVRFSFGFTAGSAGDFFAIEVLAPVWREE